MSSIFNKIEEIIYLEEIDSTQEEAKRQLARGKKSPAMIIAKKQTNGKGTHGRKWYTEESGNIAFTIILFPNCKVKELENLTINIAKSIVNTVKQKYGYELEIKHPNDLMMNGKKIGGILTEISTKGEQVENLLIGIGFNVNQEKMPREIESIATSLKIETGKEFNEKEIIEEMGKGLIEFAVV